MLAIRVLQERPIVGGEKFAAVIGPSPTLRTVTGAALAAALVVVAAGILSSSGGVPGRSGLLGAGALFGVSLASAWLFGGPEELVCQGGMFRHRHAGSLLVRGRVVRIDEIRSVRGPTAGDRSGAPCVRLETAHGVIRVGRCLRVEDARWLAEAIRGHLRASSAATLPEARPALAPQVSTPPDVLARLRVRR